MSDAVSGGTSPSNAEQAEFWEDRASSWLDAEEQTERVIGSFGHEAIDLLAPRPGERILDVGCGSGPTTVRLAELVGPDGSVVGVDISAAMIEAARARAAASGLGNVELRVADAQVDDLGDATFDAAFSRFGVMFFADPPAAFANVLRALRPGGRIAFVAWQALTANEWMFVPGAAAVSVTGVIPPMPAPGEPGPFSMADEGVAASILEAAGFVDIVVAGHDDVVRVPESELETMVELAVGLGPVQRSLDGVDDEETIGRIIGAVREAIMGKIVDGEVRMAAATWLVTARRPG